MKEEEGPCDRIRVKLHLYQGQMILAVCDEDLIGKTLDNNGIPFRISESFYGGPLMGPDELIGLYKQVSNINVIGKNAVSLLVSRGLVNVDEIIMIDGIEHVQVFRVDP